MPLYPVLTSLFLILAGCSTLGLRPDEVVLVETTPSRASVYVNGEYVGKSPIEVEVWSDNTYRFTVSKPGFRDASGMVFPIEKDRGERLVTVGPLRDAGYYTTLNTDSLHFELLHELVPLNPSGFDRSAVQAQVNRRVEIGELSLEDAVVAQAQVDRAFGVGSDSEDQARAGSEQ